ncbi:hypothetical protein G6F58_013175 [Rhizopus delemar]|nr:hypothetical protein G6F58_013175 [Rhizopus delemar]
MTSVAPSIADTLRRLRTRTKAGAAAAGELPALKRYPRRLMLACGAVLSLLSISVLVTLIVVQVNSYEARRIAEFRRAHNALQIQLGRQDASYARLANMAEATSAWWWWPTTPASRRWHWAWPPPRGRRERWSVTWS